MKTTKLQILFLTLITSAIVAFAQTNLQFTAATVTDEQAIRLTWASTNHEVYQIQCADALATNANGSTAWQILYDNYPSQGTNTFWLDTGNYIQSPAIPHPKKMLNRFYRILDEGPDDLISDEPAVSIISPTNDTSVSGQLSVTVLASSDQPVLSTKLYVDGQEMYSSATSTNYSSNGTNYLGDTYVINTCEWPNETHVFFATVKCATGFGDALNSSAVTFGRAVSPFVPVTFSNLISRISFSQVFFDPSAGQTQQVTAVFAANCDWTLQIQDADSNTVRNASGSGMSMEFDWDGKNDGGTNVLAGIYNYLINALTNGESSESMMSESMSTSSSMLALDDSLQWYATPADGSGGIVPLALYPPGTLDTNYYYIFQASPSDVLPQRSSSMAMRSGLSADDSSSDSYNGPSSQNTSAPSRPPTSPAAGTVGQFGIGYQNYLPEMQSIAAPPNGLLGHVQIQGSTANINLPFVEFAADEDFIATMARGGWQPGFVKKNGDLKASDLRSSSFSGANSFNSGGSLGLVSIHGGYGTSQDATSGANFAQQIYFAVSGSSTYVRMSEMSLGSSGTNGLKWMALEACNSLRQQNWNSIRNAGWKPFNNNLHLLLGANSIIDAGNEKIFAKKMLGLDGQHRETIYNAWQDSSAFCVHLPVQFAIAGFDDCKQDMLTGTNAVTPQGSVFYDLLPAVQ